MAALFLFLIIVIFLQVSINALLVGFTAPSSPIRLLALPVIGLCVYRAVPICLPAIGRVLWASLIGGHSLSFFLQYIDTALLSRWSVETNGPIGSSKTSLQFKQNHPRQASKKMRKWDRMRFGYFAAVTTRNVGTAFEIKGIPPFSQRDPNYVPSKGRFLSQSVMRLVSCYLTLDLLTFASQPDQNPILYQHDRIPWKNPANLSVEHLIVRSASTLGFWVGLYCVIQAYMGAIAFVLVALDLNEVRHWPPGFGPVSEAYTLRRFWGVFWHQYQKQKTSSPASFITNSILRLPRGTVLSQYTHLSLTFLCSGIEHALSDVAQGLPWGRSGAIQFFCTQATGIILEDALKNTFHSLVPNGRKHVRLEAFSRTFGYVWVFIFMVWSTPVWIYPSLSANKGEAKDLIVPFSLIRFLSRKFEVV